MIDLDNRKGVSANADDSKKLTKKEMKKSSSTKEEREMDFTGSGSNLRKKLKLPVKVLRDCNSVNHAKVPRKLRSAMKKRNSGSVSPPLLYKKQNYATDGVRFAGQEGKKKLRGIDESEIAQITKDEEEAVETLFSLAKMFPNDKKSGSKRESAEAKSPPLASENEDSAHENLEIKCPIKPSLVSISRSSESEPSMIINSRHFAHKEAADCEKIPAIAAAVGSVHEREFTMENSRNIGLWPGLSSPVSFGADSKESPINSPTAYNSAISSKNDTLADKDIRDPFVRNKSWKRCLAHFHISRLIKDLQAAEKTSNIPIYHLNQFAKNRSPEQEDHINKSVPEIAAAEKNQNETRNDFLLPKPSFDFLSLSAGGGEMESAKTTSRTGNLIEPWGPFHIPYLQSIAQNHANIPFSPPQSHYFTSPYNDNFPASAAKKVPTQLQSYSSNMVLSPAQIQYQQQRIWASQFAVQYKPMGLSAPQNNLNMQNIKLDDSTNIPISHSPELFRPMYIPMNPQQGHNLIPLTSSLPISIRKNFTLPLHLL